jgi:hypothetical protein
MLFLGIYKLFISNLTHFKWMRMYLLASLIISVILPLVHIPIQTVVEPGSNGVVSIPFLLKENLTAAYVADLVKASPAQGETSLAFGMILLYGLIGVYCIGFLYKTYAFAKNLILIQAMVEYSPKQKQDQYWIVNMNGQIPAFSFFNYIFINKNYKSISSKDVDLILNHEKVHARQLHSLDVLMVELLNIAFWFNPLFKYLKKSVQEVHEFIVDEEIVERGHQKKAYADLLLDLASDAKVFNLSAGFTGKSIQRRISMIAKPRTSSLSKLAFLAIVPLTVFMLLSFSTIDKPASLSGENLNIHENDIDKRKIAKVEWHGNTVYDDLTLSKSLGLKNGDYIDLNKLKQDLETVNPVSDLYQNNGYIFLQMDYTIKENPDKSFDLSIKLSEGSPAKIVSIKFKGNETVSSKSIKDKISLKAGDVFNKSELINSIGTIASMEKFNPEQIVPNITPDLNVDEDGYAKVNIVFELVETTNK